MRLRILLSVLTAVTLTFTLSACSKYNPFTIKATPVSQASDETIEDNITVSVTDNTPSIIVHNEALEALDSQEDNTVTKEPEMNIYNSFYIEEFTQDSELFNRIVNKSYKQDCTVPVSDLRYVHVLHIDFNGDTREGELICNKAIAEDLVEIFTALYEAEYPIEKIRLVDEYDADDERSMADNNSSCFNFRFISYTTTVSNHGLGMAVDINPLYNPYVKTVKGALSIEPSNAIEYVDRSLDFDYKIDENDLAYRLFIEHGFSWGGSWNNSKDYQHFEKSL